MHDEQAKHTVIRALQKILPNIQDDIAISSELYADLRIDSRRFIRVIQEIELLMQTEISDEDILDSDLVTVNDLIILIDKLKINKNI